MMVEGLFMGQRAVLGIDIGGTKTLCALLNEKFRFVQEIKFGTIPDGGKEAFLKRLTSAVVLLSRRARKEKLKLLGAGIAIAGNVDREQCTIEASPNIL